MRPVAGLLLLTALLAGCATVVPPPPAAEVEAAWNTRQDTLRPVTTWQLRGRLALRTADQGWHATLNWERNDDRHRLDFTGPLGRGHLRLVQDDHGAELRDADQRVWRAENPESLMLRATGWRVPLDGLNYWVMGLPMPGAEASRQLDAQGRLASLAQSGWDIRFLEYARYGAFDLPSKLYFTRRDPRVTGGTTEEEVFEVRLSIERWTFGR